MFRAIGWWPRTVLSLLCLLFSKALQVKVDANAIFLVVTLEQRKANDNPPLRYVAKVHAEATSHKPVGLLIEQSTEVEALMACVIRLVNPATRTLCRWSDTCA